MYQRLTALTSLAAAAIVVTCAVAPLAGQATPGGNKATATPASTSGWRTPRTPWGDPDLQGNFTNLYEQGTPLERPDQFAGRTLDEVQGEELKKLEDRSPGAHDQRVPGADPRARQLVAGRARLEAREPGVARRRSAGRQDSADDRRRRSGGSRLAQTRGGERTRSGRLLRRPQPLRSLHHARPARLDDAGHLRQLLPDRAGPRVRRDPATR